MATNSLPTVLVEMMPELEGIVPVRATPGSAGCDISSAVDAVLPPKGFAAVSTGIRLSIPKGHEAQIRPRSGLAAKFGVTVLNAPGTIDSDYRGEVKVLLINHGDSEFRIEKGMRIAQLVFAHVCEVSFRRVEYLDPSSRGGGGFGSTGEKPIE